MSKKEQPIIGFKGFDKHFKCREKQYAENETFEELATPELCKAGMHYCETPLDVFTYYAPDGKNQYAKIEDIGDKSVKKEDGEKSATNKLNIKTKISIGELFKAHFELILKKVKVSDETVNTAGYEAHANTAGYGAIASSLGIRSKAWR